ncbi:MAG: HlyD family type I secretion periplasmic adaptor subunit [Gammaproteobacteria bacterium]|nr:HlyD family type I secretion periplasmic adaptor subunit [Gammaproteobacteria bacterium]
MKRNQEMQGMNGGLAGSTFDARRPLLLGAAGLGLLFTGLFGWSALTSISAAVIAPGTVEVESRNQLVEHIDGGTVSEILVRDGDRVARGQVLLRFDGANLELEESILSLQYAEAEAQLNRLAAEITGAAAVGWSAELLAVAAGDARAAAIIEQQQALFDARREARDGEIAQLNEQIEQTSEEIRGLEANASSLGRQLRLLEEDLPRQRELLDRGLAPMDRIIELELRARGLEGQQGANDAAIARARAQVAEIRGRMRGIDARRIEEAAALRGEISQRGTVALESLLRVRARLQSLELKAPDGGIVFGMTVTTPGEVVGPGEPILEIVPATINHIARGRVDPIHVDQLFPGQPAVLRFSAFPARVTPEFDGSLRRISADAVYDEALGLSWFEVDVSIETPRTGGTAVQTIGDLALTPGMPVEIYIESASRSPLSYLLKPLTDYFSRSMREE